jgi:hypothetical protein
VVATVAATVLCKKKKKTVVQCHVLPSHSQAGAAMINIQPTLYAFPDLCKNISHPVLFGSNSNPYTVTT